MRRKYMDLSLQSYYHTTATMLDKGIPPSSDFCVPDKVEGKLMYTSAGDVIAGV